MSLTDTHEFQRVDPDTLRDFVCAVYETTGATAEDAYVAADAMVQADLWGHQSHGVLRLGWYYARLRSGAMRSQTNLSFPVDAGAIAVMDGGDSIGPVVQNTPRSTQSGAPKRTVSARCRCATRTTSAPACTSRAWPPSRVASCSPRPTVARTWRPGAA